VWLLAPGRDSDIVDVDKIGVIEETQAFVEVGLGEQPVSDHMRARLRQVDSPELVWQPTRANEPRTGFGGLGIVWALVLLLESVDELLGLGGFFGRAEADVEVVA
jgi:hypothetical protein